MTGTDLARDQGAFWSPNATTGFVPDCVQMSPLDLACSPYPTLQAVGRLAPQLGSLSDDELEEHVAGLPDGSDADPASMSLQAREATVRAYAHLAAHLIHRPKFASRRELPLQVARPLWLFSASVGRPPSLTYASYVLANFTNVPRPRMAAAEVEVAQTLTGTVDEEWFIAVHLSVETAGGDIVAAVDAIERALDGEDEAVLVDALASIESSLDFATDVLPSVCDRLDADIFVEIIRPLLYGHDRIHFRGIPGDPLVTYIGETGAQSGAIRAADAVLATSHSDLTSAPMRGFLMYAPLEHQHFCVRAEDAGRRLALVRSVRVREARRRSLRSLVNFRQAHYEVVAQYLMPSGRHLASRGTGGTDFKNWLRKLVDETESALSSA